MNGYLALGLMYFFTVGEDEVKAWTVQVVHVSVILSFHVPVLLCICMFLWCSI